MGTQQCPVCNGSGYVTMATYWPIHPDVVPITTTVPTMVPCRACGGRGVIVTGKEEQ